MYVCVCGFMLLSFRLRVYRHYDYVYAVVLYTSGMYRVFFKRFSDCRMDHARKIKQSIQEVLGPQSAAGKLLAGRGGRRFGRRIPEGIFSLAV